MLAYMRTATPNRRRYPEPRPKKSPPHAPISALRLALGLTQEDVCRGVNEYIPEARVTRGTISAIESGAKGVSTAMLAALEHAYGLPEGTLVTEYVPRNRREVAA